MKWDNESIIFFIYSVSKIMHEKKDELIELDGRFGDGDLGLTMSDGFQAAYDAIKDSAEKDVGILMYAAGKAMSSAVPSTMGTLMASGLLQAGKSIKGRELFDVEGAVEILSGWQSGVEKIGKAKVGEKTFLDGLVPAVEYLKQNTELELVQALSNAVEASKIGANGTVGMLAMHGRAAIRGEQSRQHIDPGAVVASLIVEGLAETAAVHK